MNHRSLMTAVAAVGALLVTLVPGTASAAPEQAPVRACADGAALHCYAMYRSTGAQGLRVSAPPAGFGPAELREAYKLPATGGAGQTIAIVDAYDNPSAEADLAVYRKQFGLPECSTANGCFRKVNQRGDATPLPKPDSGWGVEIALDLDMASAACPQCKLLLVEGDDPSFAGLAQSVDTAVKLGASVVSNSYGADEFNGMDTYAGSYKHPGVPILASSGDAGFQPASFPAVLTSVISVGGTSLTRSAGARGWSETAWSGAGSGCSAWVAKPAWQHDPNCRLRTSSDVSAVADPKTGLAVYDTYGLGQRAGWLVVGGTSASSPFVAGVLALAGHGKQINDASFLYTRADKLFDVVGGSNGFCGEDYLCTGLPGYDAPTGLGTPDGIGAF
ncbi:peptidase S8 [Kutzneria viridogrisea]|uniref:Peptidase S8/S53 subtilisin kexin sedolisin n=2 Tax=Kutzneria TaxID=43356 RepID=W5W335_9PSEU|nr:S53 family peptidase [Kutzneria albida]AHH94921.1 peptidase S8/S53 subtilisin kexin sedolisin [Kutzneria albida DSM 43870]MBA8927747.1 subtilase family serine protease [Kutzneria viridogrisea]